MFDLLYFSALKVDIVVYADNIISVTSSVIVYCKRCWKFVSVNWII